MSDRLLKNLVIALAILAVGYAGARLVGARLANPESASFDLASLAELEIDSVHIASNMATVQLGGASTWSVNGYEAIPESREAFKRALEQTRVGEVVSRNPDNYGRLGVADGQGRTLTVFSGDETYTLILSDRGQTFDDAYVRRPSEEEVRIIRGNLVDLARRDVDGWRNKQILSLTADDIQRVEFGLAGGEFSAERDSLGWILQPSGVRASDDMGRVVRELASLRAIGFGHEMLADSLPWDDPAGVVRAFGPGEVELGEVTFISRGTSGYFVRLTGKRMVYTLSQYSGDQVLKGEAELSAAQEE